jgi:hypothetical protein
MRYMWETRNAYNSLKERNTGIDGRRVLKWIINK